MTNKGKPQEWLKNKYKDKNITEIKTDYGDEFDKGDLKIEDYPDLKTMQLGSGTKGTKGVTKLTISGCLNIEKIEVYDNEITEIVGLENLSKLRKLNCGANAMTKIDVSKNTNLEVLLVHDKNEGMKVEGIENLSKLVKYSGGNINATGGISLDLTKIGQEAWKEAVEKLDIKTPGKSVEENKTLVEERGKIDRDNEQKLNNPNTGLPGLLNNKGEVVDDKLKEVNEDQKEIKGLHDVNNNSNNDKILENNRFSQDKFNKLVEKNNDYDQLVTKNDDLVENGKISQGRIDGIKNANKDAAAAITRLGVNDLNIPTLNAKLGDGTNLSHVPTTVKDLIEENKKLEDALNKVGIDPKGQDVENQLEKLKKDSRELEITRVLTGAEIGVKSWEQIEAQIKAQVLIETNK